MADRDERHSNTRAAGIVGLAVMFSRVLGLIREQVLAALFGASRSMDAFIVAFRTPNMLRDLFAEGALSTAFITTFSKKIATEGDKSAWTLANKMITLVAVAMSIISLLGVLLAPVIINYVLARGFDPDKAELTILLARIMYPFILLVSLAAVVMGMLNARRVFGMPALASSFFNLGSIIGGVSIGWYLDPSWGERALVGLAIGTLIGGLLQLLVQLPVLYRVGYRFRPDFLWKDEGVRTVLKLMLPAVIAASAVQINVLVNTAFASYLEDGAVSYLGYAFRLMQLPLGVFGVAVATITLPAVSRSAASHNMAEYRATLARGMRLVFCLTLPSALGLALLAEPIISLIFERRQFDYFATVETAAALQYYAVGLLAYSGIKVLAPAFYAIDKRYTPMMVSFMAIGFNLFLNWFFAFYLGMGHRGLALSVGLVATINFLTLYALMWRELKFFETGRMLAALLKLGIAGGLLCAICYYGQMYFLAGFSAMGVVEQAVRLVALIAVAAGAFFATAFLLGVEETRDIVQVLLRKFLKRAG